MDTKTIQHVLHKAGYYKGEITGTVTSELIAGALNILKRHIPECTSDPMGWPAQRQLVGAVQLVLTYAGHKPGLVDGYEGHNTENAYREWAYKQATGQALIINDPVVTASKAKPIFPFQKDCPTFYGKPGAEVESRLVAIDLPYTMRLDWNLAQTTKKMKLHAKCADSASDAYEAVLKAYGIGRIQELGLDRFAGSYINRNMRGGKSPSMHAYGCAIDHYAAPNGLTTRAPDALFSRKDYVEFFDIWESFGWVSLGRAIGRDYMHLQAARL